MTSPFPPPPPMPSRDEVRIYMLEEIRKHLAESGDVVAFCIKDGQLQRMLMPLHTNLETMATLYQVLGRMIVTCKQTSDEIRNGEAIN